MTVILPQFHHCDCEMCEWPNFGTWFKFPCIVWIYAWFFMHCRNHHSDSHANHVIIQNKTVIHMTVLLSCLFYCHHRYRWLSVWQLSRYSVIRLLITINCSNLLSWHILYLVIIKPWCSNYIFILDLTPGFNGLGRDNYQCWDLVSYTRGLTKS